MFNNIGAKIKTLVTFLCWIGIIASCVGAILYWSLMEEFLGGLGILVGGCLFFWISSFILYGYGELIENSAIIANKITPKNTSKPAKVTNKADVKKTDSSEAKKPVVKIMKCEMCDYDHFADQLKDCALTDEYGTRYRKLCQNCIEKHNAKVLK